MVNKYNQIFIEQGGKLVLSEVNFTSQKALLSVIERIVRKFIYIDEKNPNMIINFIFEKIFTLEKYLLKIFRFPFGLSLLMIIKKS